MISLVDGTDVGNCEREWMCWHLASVKSRENGRCQVCVVQDSLAANVKPNAKQVKHKMEVQEWGSHRHNWMKGLEWRHQICPSLHHSALLAFKDGVILAGGEGIIVTHHSGLNHPTNDLIGALGKIDPNWYMCCLVSLSLW